MYQTDNEVNKEENFSSIFLFVRKLFLKRIKFIYLILSSDHSATIPSSQKQLTDPKTCELMNIIRTELTKPSHRPSVSTKDIAIQCLSDEFNSPITQSDVMLIVSFIIFFHANNRYTVHSNTTRL